MMSENPVSKARVTENLHARRDSGLQRIGGYLFHVKDIVYIHDGESNVKIAFRSGQEIVPLASKDEVETLRAEFMKYHDRSHE